MSNYLTLSPLYRCIETGVVRELDTSVSYHAADRSTTALDVFALDSFLASINYRTVLVGYIVDHIGMSSSRTIHFIESNSDEIRICTFNAQSGRLSVEPQSVIGYFESFDAYMAQASYHKLSAIKNDETGLIDTYLKSEYRGSRHLCFGNIYSPADSVDLPRFAVHNNEDGRFVSFECILTGIDTVVEYIEETLNEMFSTQSDLEYFLGNNSNFASSELKSSLSSLETMDALELNLPSIYASQLVVTRI